MEPSPRVVLFDADGVLCVPVLRHAAYLERVHGITREATSDFFRGPFRRCLVGDGDLHDVLRPFLELWGWKGSARDFTEEWFAEERGLDDDLVLIAQALRQQGLRCGVATNQEQRRLDYMRAAMGFENLFDVVLGSAELRVMKPDRRFFDRATASLGTRPSEVLFFDDHEPNVEAARAFGWTAFLYSDVRSLMETLSELVPGFEPGNVPRRS
jgi:putative hydrolase of the HAD superfamily